MCKMKKKLIVLVLCLVINIFCIVNVSSLELIASASSSSILRGESVQFNVQASGGTGPYSYCWDFSTSPENAKVGEWNIDYHALCYSTEQNPLHQFNQLAKFRYIGILIIISEFINLMKN